MFEDLIKEIERLDGQKVSVPIESDEKGYIDKQCPAVNCEFIFKVNHEDYSRFSEEESVWCPMCKHEAQADQWFTIEQIEHARSQALAIVKAKLHNAMRSSAQRFNRRQPKNSFISISMSVRGGIAQAYAIPAKAAEVMQLEIRCEECNLRFAVIGSAYFCPGCGHNSVVRTFTDSLRKIRAKKDNVELIKKTLSESVGKDEAELTSRSLIETCISDGVVAFQKYCEGMYTPYGNVPFNAFQRLESGSALWLKAIDEGFHSWLSEEELKNLGVVYQKRHLLAHNEGIVDEKYLEKSGDRTYKLGQRIVITNRDIDLMVEALRKLESGIRKACGSQQCAD